jgi:hypothetical protein
MWNVYNAYLSWKWSTIGGYDHQRETFLYMLQVTRNLHCTLQKDRFVTLSAFSTLDTTSDEFTENLQDKRSRRCKHLTCFLRFSMDLLSVGQAGFQIGALALLTLWRHLLQVSSVTTPAGICHLVPSSGQAIGDNSCMLRVLSLIPSPK